MVERAAVNRKVVGSSPTRGALGRQDHFGGSAFSILGRVEPYPSDPREVLTRAA
jgi:hypothetical protein